MRGRAKKAEVDSGKRAAVPTDVAEKLKALERENRELRQANEILRRLPHILLRRSSPPLCLPSNGLRIVGTL